DRSGNFLQAAASGFPDKTGTSDLPSLLANLNKKLVEQGGHFVAGINYSAAAGQLFLGWHT
ncbi:hypothetical protein ACOV11_28355, partial [Vibrio natriegens]